MVPDGGQRACTGRAESQETTAIKMVWGRAWGKSKKARNTLVLQQAGTERVDFEPTGTVTRTTVFETAPG